MKSKETLPGNRQRFFVLVTYYLTLKYKQKNKLH